MIVLDTNVVSVMMQPQTGPRVIEWLDTQPTESIWTTSITLFEIRFGLSIMAQGKKRRVLEGRFDRVLREGVADRVLVFDAAAAREAAEIAANLRSKGQTVETRDVQIAGIVAARRGTLATRNTKHFTETGITLVDPWGS